MSISTQDNYKISLGHLLKQTQHALRLEMDNALKNLELTTPQYAVLARLECSEKISNAELARRSFITAQTMHGIVSNLEKRGLLTRKNNPNHGRVLSAELTQQGKILVHKAHNLVQAAEQQMTSTMTHDRVLLLEKLLSECLANFNNRTSQ